MKYGVEDSEYFYNKINANEKVISIYCGGMCVGVKYFS